MIKTLPSMSAFTALNKVYSVMRQQPELTFEQACQVSKDASAEGYPHDYFGAAKLYTYDQHSDLPEWSPEWIRSLLSSLIMSQDFPWKDSFKRGRSKLLMQLTDNERQVFESAGLCDEQITSDVLTWWDKHQAEARVESNDYGFRDWERKSLELERDRLRKAGCPYSATWVAVEDNEQGFDIQSFDFIEGEWLPICIEVKSRRFSGVNFELTRNECEKLQLLKERYKIHYWNVFTGLLTEIPGTQLLKDLPQDNGRGKWTSVVISISSTVS